MSSSSLSCIHTTKLLLYSSVTLFRSSCLVYYVCVLVSSCRSSNSSCNIFCHRSPLTYLTTNISCRTSHQTFIASRSQLVSFSITAMLTTILYYTILLYFTMLLRLDTSYAYGYPLLDRFTNVSVPD